jgi:hypothetical protein
MNVHQVAVAAGADRKWLINSAAILKRPLRFTADGARWWGLVRQLTDALGLSLGTAARIATKSLTSGTTVSENPTKSVILHVDLERYASIFLGNLSRALVQETPKRRGRPAPARKGRSAIAAARSYGIDIGLLQAALQRTPAQRLAMAEANARFVREMRGDQP